MTADDEKARLAKLLTDTQQAAVSQLNGVDPYRLIYPAGGWRVKDILTHLTAWEEEMLKSLRAYQQGSEYRLMDRMTDDARNAIFFEQREGYAPERVLTEWAAVREQLASVVRELSDGQFAGKCLFPWGERQTVTYLLEHDLLPHMQEHLDDIEKVIREGV